MVLVLMPCARAHVGVGTGGPHGAALLGAEDTSKESAITSTTSEQAHQRWPWGTYFTFEVSRRPFPLRPASQNSAELFHARRSGWPYAHDAQVNGIQRKLGQNTGQDGRECPIWCAIRPCTSPVSTPATSAISSDAQAGHPASSSITVTAPPVAKEPSTVRSAISSSRKVI